MILPDKHIRLAESIFGLSSFVLSLIEEKNDVDTLWQKFTPYNNTEQLPANHSFDNFILSLDLLFSLNLITLDDAGAIVKT